MQSAIEQLEGLKCRLTLTIPKEAIEATYQERLAKAATGIKLDRFRKGKVPNQVIESRFGKELRNETAFELIEQYVKKATQEHNIKVAGQFDMPEFKSIKIGEPLECSVSYEKYPEITLGDFSALKIEKPVCELADADLEAAIDKLRESHTEWEMTDEVAKEGDKLFVDFTGTLEDGEAIPGGSGQNVELLLGSKQMIPGFEEALIGVRAGEERELKLKFPKEYHAAELAGKAAAFQTKVHKVESSKRPEVNDAFAKKMNIEGGVEGLRSEMKQQLERNLQQSLEDLIKERVLDVLIDANGIEVPIALINMEIDALSQAAKENAKRYGMKEEDAKKLNFPREMFEANAQKRVKIGLLLAEIIKIQNITLDEAKLDAKIKETSAMYPQPEETEKFYRQNANMMENFKAVVLEDQVVELVLDSAKIKDQVMKYDDVVNWRQKAAEQEQANK